jgi:hypothetical protein
VASSPTESVVTYWQMDDKFLGHHKTIRALRAGAEALQMWLALRNYVAHNETDGEIPDEDIDDLPGAPAEPRKWLKVLVECGKPQPGGTRLAGLVDPCPCGWKMHNYEKHGLTRQQIEHARKKAKERKDRYRDRQDGTGEERRSESVPDGDGTEDEQGPRGYAPARALPSHPLPSQDHTHTSELLAPTSEHQKLGAELGLDVAYEFARFKDQAKGKGRQDGRPGSLLRPLAAGRGQEAQALGAPRLDPRRVTQRPRTTSSDARVTWRSKTLRRACTGQRRSSSRRRSGDPSSRSLPTA